MIVRIRVTEDRLYDVDAASPGDAVEKVQARYTPGGGYMSVLGIKGLSYRPDIVVRVERA